MAEAQYSHLTHTTDGLPDVPFFRRLLFLAHEGDHTAIHDIENEIQASPSRLLHDVLSYRDKLREFIGPAALDDRGIVRQENFFIIILSPGNYEFMVVLCAILAVGAAAIPLATSLLPEEVSYFYEKFNAALILTGSGESQLTDTLQQQLKGNKTVHPIQLPPPPRGPVHLFLDESVVFDSERPALALFTSGTTGPPKGLVHSIRYFNAFARELGSPEDVLLFHRPIHNGVGLTDVVRYMLRGNRVDMMDWTSGPEGVWKHLQQGGVTILTGSAGFWVCMKEYFENELSGGSPDTIRQCEKALGALHTTRCSGSLTMPSTKQFYRAKMGGRAFVIRYGTTETGPIGLETSVDDEDDSFHSIGRPLPGVEAKLATGDHSELLIKTPTMFIGYWDNERATNASFDDEGFYRTGDLASMQGDMIVIEGRINEDFITCDSYKVPVVEVETAISSLPHISESHVLPVADPRMGDRVAALVAYRAMPGGSPPSFTLESLRKDLSGLLSTHKLPTVLRVLRRGEAVPRNDVGKVIKRKVKELYFPQSQDDPSLEELPSAVQTCDYYSGTPLRSPKSWDWAGMNC